MKRIVEGSSQNEMNSRKGSSQNEKNSREGSSQNEKNTKEGSSKSKTKVSLNERNIQVCFFLKIKTGFLL